MQKNQENKNKRNEKQRKRAQGHKDEINAKHRKCTQEN